MASYWYGKTRSKYGNVEREYGGRVYHSKREAQEAMELDILKKAGEIKEIIPQYKIDLRGLKGDHICNYYIDFRIEWTNGTIEYREVKGFETEVWRLKWKLTEQQMELDEPEAKLSVVR